MAGTAIKKGLIFCVTMVVLAVLVIGAAWVTTFISDTHQESKQRGFKGKVHQADPELGFSPIPNSQGRHVFPVGESIPMEYDSGGFRVPAGKIRPDPSPRPLVLALGGSFTYGDANFAEDTFPYLVAQALDGTEINAGVCSYGLTQMQLLAKRLIPEIKPDIVLVQYSDWLVDRAMEPFAPVYFGRIPVPYFYSDDQGKLTIHPPVFLSRLPAPRNTDRDAPHGLAKRIASMTAEKSPRCLYDVYHMTRFHIRKFLGKIPAPEHGKIKVLEQVYGKIFDLCQNNKATMVIVSMRSRHAGHLELLASMKGVIFVDTLPVLNANLKNPTKNLFEREYFLWREGICVDSHPNAKEHQIMADAIVAALTGQ